MRYVLGFTFAVVAGVISAPVFADGQSPTDFKTDDLKFVPYTSPYPNPRKIVGYYEVPASWARPANDGVELQVDSDGRGGYIPSMKQVDPLEQLRVVGANGHLNPKKIIIGMPPYPELEGTLLEAGEAHVQGQSTAGGSGIPVHPRSVADDPYLSLFNGESISMTYSHTTNSIYGNATYPYDSAEAYNPGNDIVKPSNTNHQWLSVDFTTTNFSTAGAHFALEVYRWRQLYATGGFVSDTYPLVGAGVIAGDNSGSAGGCGFAGSYVGDTAPKINTQTELFGRTVWLAAGDPYFTVSPAYTPNHDPYGSAGLEIPATSSPYQAGGNTYSPSCSTAGISDGVTYRLIAHASDGGWVAYFLYQKVGTSWTLLASSSIGASPSGTTGTSAQLAPTSYTVPKSTIVGGPGGATYYAYRASPVSAYGTFDANQGGFGLFAIHGNRNHDWSIAFTNIQFGACLEGTNCTF